MYSKASPEAMGLMETDTVWPLTWRFWALNFLAGAGDAQRILVDRRQFVDRAALADPAGVGLMLDDSALDPT